jgi:hypothetical protein
MHGLPLNSGYKLCVLQLKMLSHSLKRKSVCLIGNLFSCQKINQEINQVSSSLGTSHKDQNKIGKKYKKLDSNDSC